MMVTCYIGRMVVESACKNIYVYMYKYIYIYIYIYICIYTTESMGLIKHLAFSTTKYWWSASYATCFAIHPNQELSGAKSSLQGETVGVCSSYKRGGQPPYNLLAAHLRFTGIFPLPHYKQQYHLRPTVVLQGNSPPPNYKHSYELRPTCGQIPVIVTYLEINYIM